MEKQETERSVTPDREALAALRKQRGMTMQGLSEKCGIGFRTAQKLCAGEPVDIETLRLVAAKLDVPYESLTTRGRGGSEPMFLIRIDLVGGGEQAEKIKAAIAFLTTLLPDSTGVCVIGVVGSAVLVSAGRTEANAAALGAASGEGVARGFGKPVINSSAYLSIPQTIHRLGDDEPYDYMEEGRRIQQKGSPEKGNRWGDWTQLERLKLCIQTKAESIAKLEAEGAWDWALIRGNSPSDPERMGAEERHGFIEEELPKLYRPVAGGQLVGLYAVDRPRCHELMRLRAHSIHVHSLRQLRVILAKLKRWT